MVGDRYLRWLSGPGGLSNLSLTGYQALLVLDLVRELRVPPSAVGVLLALGRRAACWERPSPRT